MAALAQRQQNNRHLDEYAERKSLLERKPTAPVLKPEGMSTGRPNPEKQAAINVAARYGHETRRTAQAFQERVDAILDGARARHGLPPAEKPVAAVDRTPAGNRLEPETITPAYIQQVEALTEQENLRQGANQSDDYPLNWPDRAESEYPLNWPGDDQRYAAFAAAAAERDSKTPGRDDPGRESEG